MAKRKVEEDRRERQTCEKREKRPNKELRGERKSQIKNYYFWFGICVRIVPILEWYCSLMQNVLAFKTPHMRCFLVCQMPNKQTCEKREKRLNKELRGERKGQIKNYYFWFGICVHTIPILEWYCSLMPNVLAFKTPQMRCFLVCQMPNI